MKILEEAHTLDYRSFAFFFFLNKRPLFLLGFVSHVILMGTLRCGGSGTCLENVVVDTFG